MLQVALPLQMAKLLKMMGLIHFNAFAGAMVASWVAQASFEPLGLTVAVAKDRAIESLMQVLIN